MRLKLTRNWPRSKYIIGRFYVEGDYFCNSLEPAWQDNARYTAIPPGIYEVIMSYSPKFKRVLPLLRNVPGRDSIRIHRGNYPKDTQGCILLGENTKVGAVLNSTKYEERICKLIGDARARREMVTLEIV